jgi:nicotinamide-nucleotide amidase
MTVFGPDWAALVALATRCVEGARRQGERFGIVESLTGGLMSAAIIAVPGASAVFEGSVTPYSNTAKQRLTGSAEPFVTHGSVSEAAAVALAAAFIAASDADHAVASTGIAGPGGGTAAKPVGLVWQAGLTRGGAPAVVERRHPPDLGRGAIVEAAAIDGLSLLAALIERRVAPRSPTPLQTP